MYERYAVAVLAALLPVELPIRTVSRNTKPATIPITAQISLLDFILMVPLGRMANDLLFPNRIQFSIVIIALNW